MMNRKIPLTPDKIVQKIDSQKHIPVFLGTNLYNCRRQSICVGLTTIDVAYFAGFPLRVEMTSFCFKHM